MINQAVSDRLEAEGYDVVRAWDGPGAVAAFSRARAGPGASSTSCCPGTTATRSAAGSRRDRPVPVLMLTARVDEADVLVGLGVGPTTTSPSRSGCASSSPGSRPLLRRVERAAELARPACRSSSVTCGSTPAARRVWRGDEEVRLTPTEFDLLVCLAGHPGHRRAHASS